MIVIKDIIEVVCGASERLLLSKATHPVGCKQSIYRNSINALLLVFVNVREALISHNDSNYKGKCKDYFLKRQTY